MADGALRNPLLAHHKQQQEVHKGRTESVAGRVLAASSAVFKGRSYARQRTLTRRQSSSDGLERAGAVSVLACLVSPFVDFYKRFIHELNFLSLPMKAGLAASICSLLCFVPGPLSVLNKNGQWAVITADVVLGANVGVTFYKGFNRTLGTLAAAALALLVDFVASMCGAYEPYFVIFWVFVGGFFPTMFKFRRRFKDRWNYAVAMSMVTFHLLILNKAEYKDKVQLPLIRMVTILIGFLTASLVNLSIAPEYAGNLISELVAKNFERAGNMMESCVVAYCEGMVLEQVSDIRSGESEDDNIHTSFHEIVIADAEVGKLLKAVPYEPCHGKFFFGFPWHMYELITDDLRDTLYDIVALDSCLRAEIQAPRHLRSIFEQEFQCIGKECAQLFRMIGDSLRKMQHMHCLHRLQQAEEGALLLQHKIANSMSTLLTGIGAENEIAGKGLDAGEARDAYEENVRISFQDAYDDPTFATGYFGTQQTPVECSDKKRSAESEKSKRSRKADGHEDFLRRRESMSRHWNATVHRISVLSLLKFASILIELVAKAKFVVTMVDELETKARFAEDAEGNFPANNLKPGNQQV